MRKVVRRGSFTSVEDLEAKLKAFLAYFNSVLAHPFNWTYTGKPLDKSRPPPFCPPHRRPRFVPKFKLNKPALTSIAI